MTKMHEDVALTGYFFKRGAYRGQDGTYTAPLILANTFEWQPTPGPEETEKRGAGLMGEAFIIAIALFLIGAGVVYLIVLRNRTPRRAFDSDQVNVSIADLTKMDSPPTTNEALQKMSEEAKRDAK